MKINKKDLITLIIALTVIFLIFIKYDYKSSFNIKITSDYTSSGGTERKLEANLLFSNNKLINGSEIYTVNSGSMCNKNSGECGSKMECIVENQYWLNSTNKESCDIPQEIESLPTSKNEIEQQIKSGKIKLVGNSCTHGDLCYEIIYN